MGREKTPTDKAYEKGVHEGQRGGFFDDLVEANISRVGSKETESYHAGYKYGAEHRYGDKGRHHSWDGKGSNDGDKGSSGKDTYGKTGSDNSSKSSHTKSDTGGHSASSGGRDYGGYTGHSSSVPTDSIQRDHEGYVGRARSVRGRGGVGVGHVSRRKNHKILKTMSVMIVIAVISGLIAVSSEEPNPIKDGFKEVADRYNDYCLSRSSSFSTSKQQEEIAEISIDYNERGQPEIHKYIEFKKDHKVYKVGVAIVRLTVDINGDVSDVRVIKVDDEVIKSFGHMCANEAATDAVRNLTWKPALTVIGNRPIKASTTTQVWFYHSNLWFPRSVRFYPSNYNY